MVSTWAAGKTINSMAKVNSSSKTAPTTKAHSSKAVHMAMADISIIMDVFIKGKLKTIRRKGLGSIRIRSRGMFMREGGGAMCRMARVRRVLAMGGIMRGSLKMGSKMARAGMSPALGSMRAPSKMASSMEKAHLPMSTIESMLGTGKMVL